MGTNPPSIEKRTTTGKALKVNLDFERYGAFAEIGAGQEVARHFFQAGRASQTIAKTISAYDMIYSDEIYGKEKNGRYVCESRLLKMLDKEYSLLIRRLDQHRGSKTKFFSFANTVATGTAESPRCHGWMGVRFQDKCQGEYNDIVLHVRMLDRHRLQQQETLGMLGVNLIEAAFYHIHNTDDFMDCLLDNIKTDQVAIDVIKFSGFDLKKFDNPTMNLELVNRHLADAVLFNEQREVVPLSDSFFKKSLVIERGSFRPVTKTHIDVLEKGAEQLKNSLRSGEFKNSEVLQIMELNVQEEKMDIPDYLRRVETLALLNRFSMITRFPLYFELKQFLRQYTQNPLVITMSAFHLEKILQKQHYQNLSGGIFEGLGKLFDSNTFLYIYPHKTEQLCLTAKTFSPESDSQRVFQHFVESKNIIDISACDESEVYYHSNDVQKLIAKKNPLWEKLVPTEVKRKIISEKLFGYK
jgi:hypothetical protein